MIYIAGLHFLNLDKTDFPRGLLWQTVKLCPHHANRHAEVQPSKCSVHTYQVYLWFLISHEVIKPFLEDCILNCWQGATVCQEHKKVYVFSKLFCSHVATLTSFLCVPVIKEIVKRELGSFFICHGGTYNKQMALVFFKG